MLPGEGLPFDGLRTAATFTDPRDWFGLLLPWLFAPALFDDPDQADNAARASARYEHLQGAAAFKAQWAAMSSFDESPDLSAVHCPIFMLGGRQDILVPPNTIAASVHGIGHVRTALIDGAGHALHWDQPERVLAELVSFLSDVPVG